MMVPTASFVFKVVNKRAGEIDQVQQNIKQEAVAILSPPSSKPPNDEFGRVKRSEENRWLEKNSRRNSSSSGMRTLDLGL